jgi:TolB-like protein/Flp pilus assembly protein TadD
VLYYFAEVCALDTARRELRRATELVSVEPQVFDLLVYLIQNRERVVSKDELLSTIWEGRAVSESSLTSRINAARCAIGDNGLEQRLIKTLLRRGVRFVGEVTEEQPYAGEVFPQQPSAPPALPDRPSIAVLPFTNMSGTTEQDYFADGMVEEIITALSRLRWFFVIARNSMFVYRGQAVDVKQVGRELGVRYLLEGSVRKSGECVRVSCRLLDAAKGTDIWSERYERQLTDIFALQDEIAASVAAIIEPKLVAAEGLRVETRSTEHLDAWDLVAHGLWHFWKLTESESESAIAILREAVRRYPRYAPAHSTLAFAQLAAGYVGWIPPAADRDHAAQLAMRAVELDENDPWSHFALGYVAFTGRQTDEALRYFDAALDLNPYFAAAAGSAGFALALDGQSDEAIVRLEKALRMSPRDPFASFFFVGFAAAHYLAHRYGEAVRWSRRAVQLRPGYLGAHRILCASLAMAGRLEEAAAALAVLRQWQPKASMAWVERSVLYTPRQLPHFLDGMRRAGLRD